VGAYSAPPDPLAVFKGPTSKGKKGEGEERREREGKGKGRQGRGERLKHTLSQIPGYATASQCDITVTLSNANTCNSCVCR